VPFGSIAAANRPVSHARRLESVTGTGTPRVLDGDEDADLGGFAHERLEKGPPWHAVLAVGGLCPALVGSVVISSAREKQQEIKERARQP